MSKSIEQSFSNYQLITLGIELVHTIYSLSDCNLGLANNVHLEKAKQLADKWNETFIDVYVSRQGV